MMDIFETQRLVLRRFAPDDWEDLYEYLSQDNVLEYLPEWTCSVDECKNICIQRSQGDTYWAVCLKDNGKMIGHIEFHKELNPDFSIYEIGYVFNPDYQGKGYATESCGRILQHGFDSLNVHRVIATCDPENVPSWKLMERIGMRREAHFKQGIYLRKPKENEPTQWRDEYYYAILSNEWARTK